ncbi:MAG: substrate binding domain-containing protein, partial [Hyphomicrobiales bacterium]|nr:substrate binding domain-containing protein [Hyphomicrobiales bacterium]
LADMEAVEIEMAEEGGEPRGRLRVAAPAALGVRWIAPLVPEFNRRNPKVIVELGLRNGAVDLADGAWDLAIRAGHLEDSSQIARKLAPCRMALCAAPVYLAERGAPRRIDELAGHSCLSYAETRVGAGRTWRFGAAGARAIEVSGPLYADNVEALRAAAVAGMGIVCLPRYVVVDDLASGALAELALDEPPTDFGAIWAVHLAERASPKLRAFMDVLAATFAAPPWRD